MYLLFIVIYLFIIVYLCLLLFTLVVIADRVTGVAALTGPVSAIPVGADLCVPNLSLPTVLENF